MLPTNTITFPFNILGAGTTTIYTGNSTVYGVVFLQGNVSSNTVLQCNSNMIFKNFAKDTAYMPMNYTCVGDLKIVKTGNDEAMILVNYATATPPVIITRNENISSSTFPMVSNGFTHGEVLISYFLFLLVVMIFFGGILKKTWGQKERQKYFDNFDKSIYG
jgi:hypothetical protein